jgi:hypothetical protein
MQLAKNIREKDNIDKVQCCTLILKTFKEFYLARLWEEYLSCTMSKFMYCGMWMDENVSRESREIQRLLATAVRGRQAVEN